MTALRLLPVGLSLLVLGAHFLRAGDLVLVLVVAVLLALLLVRRPWAARVLVVALLLGALEWLRTLVVLAGERMSMGMPHARMVAILAGVGALTAASALAFRSAAVRRWFGTEQSGGRAE